MYPESPDADGVPPKPFPAGKPDTNVTLFLGLYLLLLAFFIMLNTISNFEQTRTSAVLGSVTDAFAPPETLVLGDALPLASQLGHIVAGRQFQAEISALVQTAIPLARVKIVTPGELMRVTLPAAALFEADTAAIRPDRQRLLDRIVVGLGRVPSGWRYDVEFVLGAPWLTATDLVAEPPLALRRAAAFARALRTRGAAAASLAAAVRVGDPAVAVLSFVMRAEAEGRLPFADEGV